MKRAELVPLTVAFLVSFLAIGLPYWSVPYGKVGEPSALLAVGLAVSGLAALVVSAAGFARARLAALAVGASGPAAIMLRVIVDCSRDPTTHNLWPFELVLGGAVGLMVSTAGAVAGAVIAKFLPNRRSS